MTRRMMATVSELALYQALSLKYAADKEAAAAELAAARRNVEEGRPPTANADKVLSEEGWGGRMFCMQFMGAQGWRTVSSAASPGLWVVPPVS